MAMSDESPAAGAHEAAGDPVSPAELERVLRLVPRGAFALCGLAVALLFIAWLAMFFGVFLPRGPVS